MKRILIPATILAMLSLTTVSCQKENLVETAIQSVENSGTRTILYTVNGTTYRQVIHSDEDLDALISTLFALAREGYTVRVMNENQSINEYSEKETVTYTTKDKNSAYNWAKEKILEGYDVTISFNQETGEYTCVATR
jgi:hypothetical protein